MRWLTSWILALNPLLLYRWYRPARLTLIATKDVASVLYPQLQVYGVYSGKSGEIVEAFVIRAGEKGCISFTWQETRQPGESVKHLLWRALRNASETYHTIYTKYVHTFGALPPDQL